MRYRFAFVSNSSSSSYVIHCKICDCDFERDDEFEGGEDFGQLSGVEQCLAGHIFCTSHKLKIEDNPETLRIHKEQVARHFHVFELDEKSTKAQQALYMEIFGCQSLTELRMFYYEASGKSCSVFRQECPICMMTEFSDEELLKFAIKMYGLNKERLMNVIRENFANYDDFKQFIGSPSSKELEAEHERWFKLVQEENRKQVRTTGFGRPKVEMTYEV